MSNRQKKKLKGQNKARGPTFRVDRNKELCSMLIDVPENHNDIKCNKNNCQFLHDSQKYLENKAKDISDSCYCYEKFGKCSRGLACRFGNVHITSDGRNRVNSKIFDENRQPSTKNQLKYEVQIALRKRTYNFELSEALIKYNDRSTKKVSA